MKYKRFVYTQIILFLTTFKSISGSEAPKDIRGIFVNYNYEPKLERIVGMWNRSFENSRRREEQTEESVERSNSANSFSSEVSKCIEDQQYQITENFSRGKNIILNCFKTMLMLSIWRSYFGASEKSTVKLLNGLVELKKIPTNECDEEKDKTCRKDFGLFHRKKNEYMRMYKKAMEKLTNERSKLNAYRNRSEEEKANQLYRVNENSQAFLSEVIRNLGNEAVEKIEEEKLKREMADPRLLTMLDAISKSYMLKFRFYPGVAARMTRSNNGGFTFDLELEDSEEELEEEKKEEEEDDEEEEEGSSSDESSTREIKDGPQTKDYFDDDDESSGKKMSKTFRGDKKKKKLKKKAKKLKKIIPYLLLPMLIQVTLLPFVFKKLFFLALKALMAGKVALILIGFNLLRNTCIQKDDYQKIRVEHYGYRRGEEYGAWINKRSLRESSTMSALSEEPFGGQKPL